MKQIKLSELRSGEKAKLLEVSSVEIQVSLMQLGLTSGEILEISASAPFGGPIAIKFNGTKIALRIADAEKVLVEKTADEPEN